MFAVLHIIWACGWYFGLDPVQARIAFRKPLTLAYDILVAMMCLIGAVVAFAPVSPWGTRLRRRPVRVIAWTGTVLLDLRAVAGLIQVLYLLVVGQFAGIGIWEPWFYLGAILFSITMGRYWRQL